MQKSPISLKYLSYCVLLTLVVVSTSRASESDDLNVTGETTSPSIPSVCRATLRSKIFPGSVASSVIACRNGGTEHESQTAFLVGGYLQPINSFQSILQNFSVIRHSRVIEKGDTVSFLYDFSPSPFIEPGEYNLVLKVYFRGGSNEETFAMVAFNSTITLHTSNTDPRTIMTYVTLIAMVVGIAVMVAKKLGGSSDNKGHKEKGSGSPASPSSDGYDMDYVSLEHQRYREKLLNAASPTSPKKSGSPKKFPKGQ